MKSNKAKHRPFSAIRYYLHDLESGIFEHKLKTVFREPVKIVRLFVQVPVHRAGDHKMPAGLEQPKGFVAQLLRAGHMLDHLRGNDRIERLIFDRDVQNITDDVNAVLARLNNVAAPIFRNGIKDLPVRFIAAADIQKSAFKVPPPAVFRASNRYR
jgi:hypothetical protein